MSDTNKQTLSSYNNNVETYLNNTIQKVDGGFKQWVDKVLKATDKSAKILEIGSGTGKDSDYFESKGYKLDLTDGSQGFVDYLNSKGKNARLLNVLKHNLGESYDLIFANAVFLHFNREELEIVLGKVYSALLSNGRLAFSLKSGSGEEISYAKFEEPRYFCYWDSISIRKLLKKVGFKNIEIDFIPDYRGKHKPNWLMLYVEKS